MQIIKKYLVLFVLLLAMSHVADAYYMHPATHATNHHHHKKNSGENSGKNSDKNSLVFKSWGLSLMPSSVVIEFAPQMRFGADVLSYGGSISPTAVFLNTLSYQKNDFVRNATLRAGFLRLISHTCIPKQAP